MTQPLGVVLAALLFGWQAASIVAASGQTHSDAMAALIRSESSGRTTVPAQPQPIRVMPLAPAGSVPITQPVHAAIAPMIKQGPAQPLPTATTRTARPVGPGPFTAALAHTSMGTSPSVAPGSAVDPFTGRANSYEALLAKYRVVTMKARIAKQEYNYESYRSRTLGGTAGATPNPQILALAKRVAALETKVSAAESAKIQPRARPVAGQAVTSERPILTGILHDASRWAAVFRVGRKTAIVETGGQVGPFRVSSVDQHGVRLADARTTVYLQAPDEPGKVNIAAVQPRGAGNMGMPGQMGGGGVPRFGNAIQGALQQRAGGF
ncbi:MAG: hypothetical protein ACYDHY_09790 [Acidiferrobacterales bacterium]